MAALTAAASTGVPSLNVRLGRRWKVTSSPVVVVVPALGQVGDGLAVLVGPGQRRVDQGELAELGAAARRPPGPSGSGSTRRPTSGWRAPPPAPDAGAAAAAGARGRSRASRASTAPSAAPRSGGQVCRRDMIVLSLEGPRAEVGYGRRCRCRDGLVGAAAAARPRCAGSRGRAGRGCRAAWSTRTRCGRRRARAGSAAPGR